MRNGRFHRCSSVEASERGPPRRRIWLTVEGAPARLTMRDLTMDVLIAFLLVEGAEVYAPSQLESIGLCFTHACFLIWLCLI